MHWRRRELLLATGLLIMVRGAAASPSPGIARRLKLYNAHTKETFEGPYRDDEGPIASAMSDLAALLRDHHVNKVGPLDVATLDFLADVMEATNQSQARILSAYRTPETNRRLRATTFGVAERSQHLFGRALDVAFDTRLADAERVALRMKRGGVGWYPRSQFIHLDTGPVRSWSLGGSGYDSLLNFRGGSGSPTVLRGGSGNASGQRVHRPPSVAQRHAIHRELARREFLARKAR
jgi:uncharacterized protein YcbK (DUF882 family)